MTHCWPRRANAHARALRVSGDPWAEDPACNLTAAEIGLANVTARLTVTPFRGKGHDPAHRFV